MKKLTITNTLILISLWVTLLSFVDPNMLDYWMSSNFFTEWEYGVFIIQIILYQFLHAWFLHLLSNSLFLYLFWNQLEFILWNNKYLLFFIFNTIFVAFCLVLLSNGITIWISWFTMAILWFLLMMYKKIDKQQFNGALVLMIINILIWLDTSISFIWHLSWAIFWIIFYMIFTQKYLKNF